MFQTELLPVTVYRSTDEGAPQLTATAGSLKTILKACLKEGYGNKPALGWDMPYEDANKAVFVSADPKSTKTGLHIDNAATRMALVKMFIGPTGLDTASAIWYTYHARYPYLTSSNQSSDWVLIGHGRAFCFLCSSGYYSRVGFSRMLWFGDFPTLAPADTGNCLLWHPGQNGDYISSSAYPPASINKNDGAVGIVAKSYNGQTYGSEVRSGSLFDRVWGVPYPDLIGQGFLASETYLHEYIGSIKGHCMRGIWPGLYACAHDLSDIPNMSEISGFNGSNDRLIKTAFFDNDSEYVKYTHLINATAWPA